MESQASVIFWEASVGPATISLFSSLPRLFLLRVPNNKQKRTKTSDKSKNGSVNILFVISSFI